MARGAAAEAACLRNMATAAGKLMVCDGLMALDLTGSLGKG
jgi:hypothetical protein